MKNSFGMRKERKIKSIQSSTFGPHQLKADKSASLSLRPWEDSVCRRKSVPILNRSPLGPSIVDSNERQGKDEVEKAEGEAEPVDLFDSTQPSATVRHRYKGDT
jgi:hypothetical protein